MASFSGDDKPSLKDLANFVVPNVGGKWYNLGLQLLDSPTELTNIKESSAYKDNEDQCREMFHKWIDTDKKASWNKVIVALKSPSVKLISLANDIEKEKSSKKPSGLLGKVKNFMPAKKVQSTPMISPEELSDKETHYSEEPREECGELISPSEVSEQSGDFSRSQRSNRSSFRKTTEQDEVHSIRTSYSSLSMENIRRSESLSINEQMIDLEYDAKRLRVNLNQQLDAITERVTKLEILFQKHSNEFNWQKSKTDLRIEQMQQEFRMQISNVTNSMQEKFEYIFKTNKLLSDLTEAQSAVHTLQDEKVSLEAMIDSLRRDLYEKEETLHKTKKQFDDIKKQFEDLKRVQSLKINSLEQELQSEKERASPVHKKYTLTPNLDEQLNNKIAKLEVENVNFKQQKELLFQQMIEMETKLQNLKDSEMHLQNKVVSLEQNNESVRYLQDKVTTLEQSNQTLEQELAKMKKATDKKINSLTSELKAERDKNTISELLLMPEKEKKFSDMATSRHYFKRVQVESTRYDHRTTKTSYEKSQVLSPLKAQVTDESKLTIAKSHTGWGTRLTAQATSAYHTDEKNQLSFKSGDIIENVEKIDEDWYMGELHGRRGLFPASHINVIK